MRSAFILMLLGQGNAIDDRIHSVARDWGSPCGYG
jgi:hypothetical protein